MMKMTKSSNHRHVLQTPRSHLEVRQVWPQLPRPAPPSRPPPTTRDLKTRLTGKRSRHKSA